jgi:hypothetical protein
MTRRQDAIEARVPKIASEARALMDNVSATRQIDGFGRIAQHSEINREGSEQASVANDRQPQDRSSPVAGRRDAHNSPPDK